MREEVALLSGLHPALRAIIPGGELKEGAAPAEQVEDTSLGLKQNRRWQAAPRRRRVAVATLLTASTPLSLQWRHNNAFAFSFLLKPALQVHAVPATGTRPCPRSVATTRDDATLKNTQIPDDRPVTTSTDRRAPPICKEREMTPTRASTDACKSLNNAHGSCQPSDKHFPIVLRFDSIRSLRVLIMASCIVAATSTFAQSVDVGGTNPSWADQGEEGCADPSEPCAAIVSRFMETLNSGNKTALADLIVFPILRPFPLPSIEREEFLDRYHEVFDDTLVGYILRSSLSDWVPVFQSNRRSTSEWLRSRLSDEQLLTRAISMQLIVDQVTLIQLEYSGNLSFIYYSSGVEKEEIRRLSKLRDTLLDEERLRLHRSLRSFESPVLEWETDTYRIRVDALGSDTFRYAAWKTEAPRGSNPDLIPGQR